MSEENMEKIILLILLTMEMVFNMCPCSERVILVLIDNERLRSL